MPSPMPCLPAPSLRSPLSWPSSCGAAALISFSCFAVCAAVVGVSCLLSILTLWVPAYGIQAAVKGMLTPVSGGIAVAFLLLLPHFLVMPTRVQLQQAYRALEEETRQRRKAEAMV